MEVFDLFNNEDYFAFKDYTDEDEAQAYFDHVNSFREKYSFRSPPTLTVVERWKSFQPAWKSAATSVMHRRPIPSQLTRTIESSDEIIIRLTRALRTGEPEWSQVWLGELENTTTGEGPADTPVVVKLFQESLFRYPGRTTEDGVESGYWPFGARQARTEASAYQLLSAHQGDLVPWSFGFFKVMLDNDEVTHAHIMEYIEGKTAEDLLPETGSPSIDESLWKSLADSMAIGIQKIHSCGVRHNDIKVDNIIITGDDANSQVVFIDFAWSRPTSEKGCKMDASYLSALLQELGVSFDDVANWYRSRKAEGRDFVDIFSPSSFEMKPDRKSQKKRARDDPNYVPPWKRAALGMLAAGWGVPSYIKLDENGVPVALDFENE